jgi:hypothetical protein
MTWDREKWNRFVSDNTKVPPTDEAAKDAAEEAKTLAETFEEDIDLDALGVARVKKMLEELAAATPSETGPPGDDGSLNPNTVNGLTTTTKYEFLNSVPAVAATQTIDNLITFSRNELDGASDVITVRCSTYNLAQVRLYWTPNLIPSSPGASPIKVWPATAIPGVINGDGYLQFFLIEGADVTNSNLRSGTKCVAMGNIKLLVEAQNQMQWADFSPIPGWMAIGGTISAQITSTTGVVPFNYGIMI